MVRFVYIPFCLNIMKNYKITFLEPRLHWNWVTVSSIDKETFLGFIDYLYNLDRDIEVLPYIPGGLIACTGANPWMDKTYLVKRIARSIKDRKPKEEIFEEFTYISNKDNKAQIFFAEDVYEMLLSLGLTKEAAVQIANEHYNKNIIKTAISPSTNSDLLKAFINQLDSHFFYFPYHSRWIFIYMFRGEFVRYMKSIGYDDVSVDGGWVLNDKEREVK